MVASAGSYKATEESSRVAKRLLERGPYGSADSWWEIVGAMQEYRILDADSLLQTLLSAISSDESLVVEVKATSLHKQLLTRVAQYEAVGRRVLSFNDADLGTKKFELVWGEKGGDQAYIYMLPGYKRAELKVVIRIDAPLRACCVPAFEMDLQPQWNKALIKAPECLGPRKRFHQVVRQLARVLMFRLELIIEVFRVCNTHFGFLAETICSEFPAEDLGVTIPPNDSWRTRRITADTCNIWIPCGGGGPDSTILVQSHRIDLGFPMAPALARQAVNALVGGIVANLKKNATMATEPGTVWQRRLQEDNVGMYAEIAKVEAAAAKRRTVTTSTLPDHTIFMRPS